MLLIRDKKTFSLLIYLQFTWITYIYIYIYIYIYNVSMYNKSKKYKIKQTGYYISRVKLAE